MKCPFCTNLDTSVTDSRLSKEGDLIRRRRECGQCQKRFTTYEKVELLLPMIIKKDGRRENFDRAKLLLGLKKASEKRSISIEKLQKIVDDIEAELVEKTEKEISSNFIGERIMRALKNLDAVAYVRFASVYRSFQDVGEFVDLIQNEKSHEF